MRMREVYKDSWDMTDTKVNEVPLPFTSSPVSKKLLKSDPAVWHKELGKNDLTRTA